MSSEQWDMVPIIAEKISVNQHHYLYHKRNVFIKALIWAVVLHTNK